MSGDAKRYNEGKNRLGLIPPFPLEEIGKVFTYGANKYEPNNYLKGMSWSKCLDSLERHLNAYKQGVDYDEESLCLHMAHIAVNSMFILQYYKTHPELDDRPHSYLQQKRIAIDVDGLICNFTKGFINLAKQKGHILPEEKDYIQAHWNFPHSMTYLWEEIVKSKDFWLNLDPIEHNKDFGFEPSLYISSRSIPVEWTTEWLEKNGFPNSKVIHTNGASKLDVLKENNIDIMVDDSWENFIDCNKGGICTYLMNASYNEKYSVGYKRIHSLKDLVI